MSEIETKLQYQFNKQELLTLALSHKSYAYENSLQPLAHNEKLEFLGDAVLDLILSEYLMEIFPDLDEGPLSKFRAILVSEQGLSQIAMDLELSKFIILGKGEILTGGAQKPRLLASCLEAVVGALFADGGYSQAQKIVRQIFSGKVQQLKLSPDVDYDYKSQLQEKIQAEKKSTPTYLLTNTLGPAHERVFEVRVLVGEEEIASGVGKSKKAAEQKAAQLGLEKWSKNDQ